VRLARLLRTGRARDGRRRPRRRRARSAIPDELTATGLERESVDQFTLMDSPQGRWASPTAASRCRTRSPGDADRTLGPRADARRARRRARGVEHAGTTLHLVRGEPLAPVPLFCDGLSQIVFNDPFDEMPAPAACSGILALGGYCTFIEHDQVNGQRFFRISEGNVTVNRGFGRCPFWTRSNLSEVLTHEIGHTIGIGHSAESESASPELRDATMYFQAHFDGRGASLARRRRRRGALRLRHHGRGNPLEDLGRRRRPGRRRQLPDDPRTARRPTATATARATSATRARSAAAGAVGGCEAIFSSRLSARTRHGRTRLVWRGIVDVSAEADRPRRARPPRVRLRRGRRRVGRRRCHAARAARAPLPRRRRARDAEADALGRVPSPHRREPRRARRRRALPSSAPASRSATAASRAPSPARRAGAAASAAGSNLLEGAA
jgi:hypothetical protein